MCTCDGFLGGTEPVIEGFILLLFFSWLLELCGTPNYLAPEVLKAGMYEDAEGYSHPVDM